MLRPQTRVLQRGVLEMSGRTEPKLMSCSDLHVLTKDISTPEQKRAFVESIRNDRPAQGIGSWDRPDGTENYHEWVAVPVRQGGQAVHHGG